jgi:hypothetical protein
VADSPRGRPNMGTAARISSQMETIDEVRGDSWTYQVMDLCADDGTVVTDLALWNCECMLKDRASGTALISKSTQAATVQRVGGPAFEIKFAASETAPLAPGTYYLSAAVISPSGTRRTNHRFNLRVSA